MPIYEYQCQACRHHLEALQKISDAPLVDCPECGKPALKKKVSAAAFRLKGSGWYETDFKKDKQKNLAGGGKEGGDAAASGSSDSSAAGKGDASPAGKGDASPAAGSDKKGAEKGAGKSGGDSSGASKQSA